MHAKRGGTRREKRGRKGVHLHSPWQFHFRDVPCRDFVTRSATATQGSLSITIKQKKWISREADRIISSCSKNIRKTSCPRTLLTY